MLCTCKCIQLLGLRVHRKRKKVGTGKYNYVNIEDVERLAAEH